MGTHPIFESDFDCLTEMTTSEEEAIGVFIELENEKPTDHTPSESTPMRKEHVPAEPKLFRPLDFQNDQNLFVRPSSPEKRQAGKIQSEPIPIFETELNNKVENTEIILTLKETQEAIQQAIRLGENEIDDSNFKFEPWQAESNQNLNDSKLIEKIEKEQSKRRFCESKIIELQKEIINLEETNHSLKDSCARKNVILGKMNLNLENNTEEIRGFTKRKNLEIEKIKKILEEVTSKAQITLDENHNLQEQIQKYKKEIRDLKNAKIDLERRNIEINDEKEDLIRKFSDSKHEKKQLDDEFSNLQASTDEKISNLKKIVESEREKVAKYEKDENSAISKSKSLQQTVDMLRVQVEQAKVMRDNLQKQIASEKNNNHKLSVQIEEKDKFHEERMSSRDEEIAEMEREQVRKANELERVEKELEAISSEFELEKTRFKTEAHKQELYYKSMIKTQLDELNQKFAHQIRSMSDAHMKKERDFNEKISELRMEHDHKIISVENQLESQYQKKMKMFLQQHFNQGLTALSNSGSKSSPPSEPPSSRSHSKNLAHVSTPQFEPLRSSSPRDAPRQKHKSDVRIPIIHDNSYESPTTDNFIPHPPVAPRPYPTSKQPSSSSKSKREQQLRKMIESMLNQTPMTENDMTNSIQSNGNNLTNSESNYFRQKIRDMVDDQSLTDKEKKNLQKLAQLMN